MKKIILISMVVLISAVFFSQAYATDMTSSFSFSQESLQSAFRDISMAFNVPIVVDSTVSGNITMNLNDVTLNRALETICKGYALFYFKYEGVYFVGTNASTLSMKVLAYSHHIINLKYLSSSDAISFLQPYANYMTYSSSYPYLFFFGPNNVYGKVVLALKAVDVPTPNLYVIYNIYSVSKSSYQVWKSAFSSSYLRPGEFTSTNFDFIKKFSNSMKLVGNGFTTANVGKISSFKVGDLALTMNVKINSMTATRSNLTLNISKTGTSSIQASSTIMVGTRQMAAASFKNENSNFIVTVSVVKNIPNASSLALAKLQGNNNRNYGLAFEYDQQKESYKAIGNYNKVAVGFDFSQDSTVSVYVGLASQIAVGLDGYLLIGGQFLSDSQNVNSYRVEFALVQYPDFKNNVFSSGSLTLSASLTSIDNFCLRYDGNLEYRIDYLLLGGELSYSYDHQPATQAVDTYLSGGFIYDKGIFRFLYSPFSSNFKFEVNWGG